MWIDYRRLQYAMYISSQYPRSVRCSPMISSGQDKHCILVPAQQPAHVLRPIPRTHLSSHQCTESPPSARTQPCHVTHPRMGPRRADLERVRIGHSITCSHLSDQELVYPLETRSDIDEEVGEHRKMEGAGKDGEEEKGVWQGIPGQEVRRRQQRKMQGRSGGLRRVRHRRHLP